MKTILTLCLIFISRQTWSSTYTDFLEKKLNYKTNFGFCPSKVAGQLTLELTGEFEKRKSMRDIKDKIVKDSLFDKYFLSDYEVRYNPMAKMLSFRFDCPKPLMKVQVYNGGGDEYYTSVLTENGKLLDPNYEVLLRAEGKLQGLLPNLAMPISAVDKNKHFEITELIESLEPEYYNKISELILSDENELTIILSFRNRPSSVFLGKDYWGKKVGKMKKIYSFLKEKNKIPAVINLTNSKKIVVKFPDTI